ncbi:transposon Tf2-6 polyprotein [Trichonephila inaurata madagascariensis]|uniref:Transposon Tf2-6 polyprotein n=1 Tax=Trichonephila inaurata madagascariensis TaxID=2747483 RepID=A0A8X6WZE3_9ARAC|nr:transposon Tf2-6 polyprotein [Trichonephila inaurata madagascariensis]
MSFFLKGEKEDLLELATELCLEVAVDMIKPMLKNLITKSAGYDEGNSPKFSNEGIIEERKERELLEERKRRDSLEIEKLRIEAQIGLNQEILSRNNRTPKYILKDELDFSHILDSQVKNDLTRIISSYKPGKKTELHTDTIQQGYGAALLQEGDDGRLHPVYNMSKKTNTAEEKYSNYELEVLDIVAALKKL